MSENLKVIKLQAENFKRLKAIEISPDGEMVVIAGKNGEGKTSVLDSIMSALAGGKKVPEMPIRSGEKKAKIRLDIGEFVVERSFTPGGMSLKVMNKDGFEVKSPQQILDGLIGNLSFDPLEFVRMDDPKKVAILKALTGLDFTAQEADRKKKYDERTILNREEKSLENQLAAMPAVAAPDKEVSVADLSKEYQARTQTISDNKIQRDLLGTLRVDLDRMKQSQTSLEESIKDLESQIEAKKNQLVTAISEIKKINEKGKTLAAEVRALVDPDLKEITDQMATAETTNASVRKNKERQVKVDQLKAKRLEIETLNAAIDKIDTDKQKQLTAAKMPIPGLAFDEAGVTFNGIPFAQISASEQLKVSLAMGMALNPKLKVMLIRDASLLDSANFKVVEQMAKDKGYQVWMEVVSDEGKVGVIIEDGMVKETV